MTKAAIVLLACLVLLLAAGPSLTRHDYAAQDRDNVLSPPGGTHWLGTDSLGRDNFARFVVGGRLSVLMAATAALAACAVAALIGTLGALGGAPARAATAIVFDVMLSTPWYLLVFVVRAALPLDASPVTTAAVTFGILGFIGWAHGARAIRDAVVGMASGPWIRQARAAGAGGFALWRGHIVPNLRPILLTQFLLLLPTLMLGEATLGMLGLGIPEPLPSWGGSLVELVQSSTVLERPWALLPAVLLATSSISLRTLAGGENS
jgi:peptide/nickel transport system permease protein